MNTLRLGAVAAVLAIATFLWFRFGAEPQGSDSSESKIAVAESAVGKTAKNSEDATGQILKKSADGEKNVSITPKKEGGGNQSGRGAGRPPLLVVTSAVSDALINDRLNAVGNGTAAASVSIVPLSGGILTEIKVNSGQQVQANTILATLDDEEQVIARDRAARTASDAATDATRLEKLFRSRTVTEVEFNGASAVLADAELALREAELMLSRRTIKAPMAGIVGLVSVDTGNYVTPQTELVTIDDRSMIVVEFWIPERFANQIAVGQNVKATALAIPGNEHSGVISGFSSRIESDSRTLKVKARIDNADDSLRPGMSFQVSMNFEGQRFPAVNPLAVQWASSGSYVWKVVNSKVTRVPVRIIQRNPESVLVKAELANGDDVVTEGVLSMRQGATVRVEGATANSPKSRSGAQNSSTKKASDIDNVTGKQRGS